ncbi:MAG: 30S ribosomal protein S26e [Candidatus Thorarchaeota archaeon]
MGRKRKSRGRSKGKKGASQRVQCSSCGQQVPRDKAKRKTAYKSLVDPVIRSELRKQGTKVPRIPMIRYYCVSCAVHRGIVQIRSEDHRKGRPRY